MAKRDERDDEEFDETEESDARGLSSDAEDEGADEAEGAEEEAEDPEDEDDEEEDERPDPVAVERKEVEPREIVEAEPEAAALGAARYVHAAFFGAGILAAYLGGKVMLAVWNYLADWPDAVRYVPQLIQYGEDERGTITLAVGALLGALLVAYYYKKETVRVWAGEVASELSRVTWPNKETVTNGTMVVLVASLVATVYVALLDRVWGYLTNLVYGA